MEELHAEMHLREATLHLQIPIQLRSTKIEVTTSVRWVLAPLMPFVM